MNGTQSNRDEWVAALAAFIIIMLCLLFSSGCTSFKKLKEKYGHKTVEIEQIPYQKTIGPDTAILHTSIDGLMPNVPLFAKSDRTGITLTADESGNITAKGFSDPIYIYDSFPYPVEKIIFKEADWDKYILISDAEKLREMALENARLDWEIDQKKEANNLTFFDKVKNVLGDIGLWIGGLLLLILIILFVALRISGKVAATMAVLAIMAGYSPYITHGHFSIEGIYYNEQAML